MLSTTYSYSQLSAAWFVLILHSSHQATVTVDLEFRRDIGAPDGFKRSIITANNIFPGPVIRATAGDSLVVRPCYSHRRVTNLSSWRAYYT